VVVGDLILDTYVYGETVRVSREAPVLVVRRERSEHRLGGAANAAANLAALGVSTAVVSAVGDDEAGERVGGMLRSAGLDVGGLRPGAAATPQKTRILAGAFGTARQQVLRLDDEPAAALSVELDRALAAELERRGRAADVVVVSDYGAGTVGPAVTAAARNLARSGRPVVVDSRHRLAELGGVTLVTPNVPEAAAVWGQAITDQASVEQAGVAILARLGCGACLITQGRAGMTLFRPGESPRHVGIIGTEEVTDVTGAGDTVVAAAAAAVAAGLGWVNAMLLANAAAAVSVMKVGTATVSPAELVASARRGDVVLEPWGG
jgi:rfaE bifunctional protein kinase chain/domain